MFLEQLRLCAINVSVASCHLKHRASHLWGRQRRMGSGRTGTIGKEELEKTVTKLISELEGWKDQFAMCAGQRIVTRQ